MSPAQINSLLKKIGIHKPDYPNWYGNEGIKYVWHNSWSDPEIEYQGKKCSCYVVEDTMWSRYEEDGFSDPDKFGDYMRDNASEVRYLCALALGLTSL